MTMMVTSTVLDGLIAEAQATHPHECCGLLFADADRIFAHRAAPNVHASPATHFEIDPKALIDAHRAARAGGPLLAGYYHSHPSGSAEPSATDRALAAQDGMIWAIVAGGEVRLWRAAANGFIALSYTRV